MAENQFSRLFPNLGPAEFASEHLIALGRLMSEINRGGESQGIPSGYVYLGQFINHDMSRLARGDELPGMHGLGLDELGQLRTAALDLDSLYGNGFDDPCCATRADGQLVIGMTSKADGLNPTANDLPRQQPSGRPIIPDDRNDENLLVAQLHLLFMRLHNQIVAALPPQFSGAKERFEAARAQVTETYQRIVLHDFLPTLLDPEIFAWLSADDGANALALYPSEQLAMPIEFAGAAFRFGHSMVQGLIEKFQVLGKEEKFFDHFLQQHNFFNDDEVTI